MPTEEVSKLMVMDSVGMLMDWIEWVIYMDKKQYLDQLREKIINAGYDEKYAALCLRYAGNLIDRNMPVIFDIKHLAMLIGIRHEKLLSFLFGEKSFYREVRIPKRSGGQRQLFVPTISLKYVQRWILDNVLSKMHTSDSAYGFISKRSIRDNAAQHVRKQCVINIDIKDFFPSISFLQVYSIFAYYGFTREMSFVLAKLCTYRSVLPQGSPASPFISNVVCLKMDARIKALADRFDATYTRYADDITISGNKGIENMLPMIRTIIRDEGFSINENKTRISYAHQRQEVTGLIVNGNNVHVSRDYKRLLNQEIYYCSKFGVSNHLAHIGCNKAFYKEHLYGKAYFIKMIERDVGEQLLEKLNNIRWDY